VLILFLYSQKASVEIFGIFVYVINLVDIFRLLIDFGVDVTYNRYLSKMVPLARIFKTVNEIIILKLTLGFVGACLLSFIMWFVFHQAFSLIAFSCFILPFILMNSFIGVFFQSKNNNKKIFPFYGMAFMAAGLVIYFFRNTIEYYQIYFLCEFFFFLFLSIALWFHFKGFQWKLSLGNVFQPYRRSFFAGITTAIVTAYTKTDLIFIKKLSSAVNLAEYGFYNRIVDPLLMIASSVSTSAYSFFSRNEPTQNVRQMERFMRFVFIYAALIVCMIGIGFPWALQLIKSKYVMNYTIAFLFGAVTASRVLSAVYTSLLYSFGKFKLMLNLSVINLVILFILYIVLVPSFGLVGVLEAIFFTEASNVLVKIYLFEKYKKQL
jgi:O-antigen/teichoic acid export membrane protein